MFNRVYFDCSEQPGVTGCTLKFSGHEDEVIKAAIDHSVSVHGFKNDPDLKERVRKALRPEGVSKAKPIIDDLNAII